MNAPVKLSDNPDIAACINTIPTQVAKLFHRAIFGIDNGRRNRSQLRNFTGFTFTENSNEYKEKINDLNVNFSDSEIFMIGNLLGIETVGKDIRVEFVRKLMNIDLLINTFDRERDEDESDEEDKNDEEEEEVRQSISDIENQFSSHELPTSKNMESPKLRTLEKNMVKCSIGFRDVEDTIRTFDGGKNYPVVNWIEDFEEVATLLGWNELEMFIYGKRSLRDLARTFVMSEKSLSSWSSLKEALMNEFGSLYNSIEMHKLLSKRRMKSEESEYEYFLIMKELASRGKIDEPSLIQYVIDGINDAPMNKMMLFGAKTLKEFKQKLITYSTYKNSCNPKEKNDTLKITHKQKVLVKEFKEENQQNRCYNCGNRGHRAADCRLKAQGKKCFKCSKFGHIAAQCETKAKDEKTLVNICSVPEISSMKKQVKIDGKAISALIDTGSEVSLIRNDILKSIPMQKIIPSELKLCGLGGQLFATKGRIEIDLEIDDEYFKIVLHVVPEDVMKAEIIIGGEFLKRTELLINQSGISIRKQETEREVAGIMNIQIMSNDAELDFHHLQDKEIKSQLREIISSYQARKIKNIDIEMKIILKDESPIFHTPRRLSFYEREVVDKQVEDWLRDGTIEPSVAEFASQVVVVKKKDGSPRVCIDFRKLNQQAVKDRYPLPVMEDQIDQLQSAKVFSTIDLKNGFFHMKVEENSKKYTSFVTHRGQYCFNRVPFGFCNSPANFQRYINTAFRDLQNEGIVFIYIDDLIIPAKDYNEAILRLKRVLKTAQDYGLEINFKKCQFLRKKVEFLGHIIQDGQISPSLEKVKAAVNYPEPKSIKDVQSFLGLTGYFRKFINGYALIAKPLSDLIRKDTKFKFEQSEKEAFESLKSLLTSKPVLNIYRRGAETEVHTDASKGGYGAILLQRSDRDGQMHPIYYFSKKTTQAEQNYDSYELEVLAVVQALKKFRIYLVGQPFKLITDCSAFERTMKKKDLITRIARWALMLSEYDYELEHRCGARMKHVDALSRYAVMTASIEDINLRIQEAQKRDDYIQSIRKILTNCEYNNFFLKGDVLYKFENGRDLIVIPASMQKEVIKLAHDKGHFSTVRTIENINQEFYIPKLREKVEEVQANCIRCIMINRKVGKQEGFLHPRAKSDTPFHTYHIDHLGPLESTNKMYRHLLVVVDDFTKFVWLYPVKSTTSRELIAKLELQKKVFGNPAQIVTDRGTAFTSEEFRNYCDEEGIEHYKITTGLPRANGQVERLNATISTVLGKLAIDEPSKWYKYVDTVQRILNSTFQRSIDSTPFEILTGVTMRNKADLKIKELIEKTMMKSYNDKRSDLREKAKTNILKVQEENKRQFNRKRRRPREYTLGDLVAIKRTQMGPGLKLKPKFLGPYRIVKVKANNTYDVQRVGYHDGPSATSTCAEYMKLWSPALGSNATQDGRSVGMKKIQSVRE